MSLHPDPENFQTADAPHMGHRLIAAALTTLPATATLTATLWAVAGACASPATFTYTAAMIFAGFFPFSLTAIFLRGTSMAARMRFGQTSLLCAFFALFLIFGPGPTFLGIPCGNGPTILQSGLLVLSITWASWWAMRAAEDTSA